METGTEKLLLNKCDTLYNSCIDKNWLVAEAAMEAIKNIIHVQETKEEVQLCQN